MSKNKVYTVGIAGGTCSGKTTLTQKLESELSKEYKVSAFYMDRYFKKEKPTVIAPITGIEYPEFNHPDSLELEQLKNDFESAINGENGENLVIIEGLFALYLDFIREKLDLKVFVDLRSDERLVRRIKRFTAMGNSFEDVTTRYIDTVRFRHDELIEPTRWHADIVLNGIPNLGPEVLLTYIRANI